jgi:hypothetical protein
MKIEVRNRCGMCGERHSVEVDKDKFMAWEAGETNGDVAEYWSDLTPEQRNEFFVSGLCPTCHLIVFKKV